MSNETPNRVHAGGIFVPTETVDPPFTSRLLATQGVQTFTRLDVGQYLITLQRTLGFSEGYAEGTVPPNFQGVAGAQISEDGATVLLTVLALGTGIPVDPPVVMCTVWSVRQGEGEGPTIPFPAIPPPVPGGGIVDWQPNVINIQTTPPGGPSDGDRYIVLPAGVGDWAGHDNEIATWDAGGAAWTFEVPENGWAAYAETPELIYIFNGTTWNAIPVEPEFRLAFDDTALAAGILPVAHGLGQTYNGVTVYDDSDQVIVPDAVAAVDANNLTVDLSSFAPIAGTWNVVVGG